MDPERVRAYLQIACAGLGFDIGEVWWTSNENGSSTVAAIGTFHHGRYFRSRIRKLLFGVAYDDVAVLNTFLIGQASVQDMSARTLVTFFAF